MRFKEEEAMEAIGEMCKGNQIVFLIKCGSNLYGTATENSDTDYRGVFIPTFESCLLGKSPKSFQTKGNKEKNTKEDVDVSMWSVQYWLSKIAQGDTNAIDLLFSVTKQDCIIHRDKILDPIFENYSKLFNVKDVNGYIGYIKSQAIKYGIKGTKFGITRKAYEWIIKFHERWDHQKLSNYKRSLDNFLEEHGHPQYFYYDVVNEKPSIVLCGKVHNLETRVGEIKKRFKKDYDQYGKRAEKAEKNKGVDWKSISHSVRAIHEMKELIETGKLEFPLITAEEILEIKLGKCDWSDVSNRIADGLAEIEEMMKDPIEKTKDHKFIDKIIIDMYKEN